MWITLIASYYKPLGIMLAMLGLFTVGYYQGYQKAEAAQVKANLAATEHVVKVEEKAATISNEVSDEYRKKVADIVDRYTHPVIVQPSVEHLSKIPPSSGCPKPQSCQWRSDVYGLTWEQCDTKYVGYKALWDWAQEQAKNQ